MTDATRHALLEVLGPAGPDIVVLDGDRLAIGNAPTNDVAIGWDATVSQLHAVIERYPSGWCVRDVGSRNGTYLNGDRIVGDHVLRHGDEIRVGETRVLFRLGTASPRPSETEAAHPAPDMTRREREVLIALCRPILERNLLTEPATTKAIAAELVISESAVKKHLGRLYDRFDIHDADQRRRSRLVSDAIRRGAVSLGDIAST